MVVVVVVVVVVVEEVNGNVKSSCMGYNEKVHL